MPSAPRSRRLRWRVSSGTLDEQHRDRVFAGKPELVNDLPDVGVDGDRASAGGGVRDPACHATVNEPPRRAVDGGEHRQFVHGDVGAVLVELDQPRQPLIDNALLLAAEREDEEVVGPCEIARQLVFLVVESPSG